MNCDCGYMQEYCQCPASQSDLDRLQEEINSLKIDIETLTGKLDEYVKKEEENDG